MTDLTHLIWSSARTSAAARTLAERLLTSGRGTVIVAGEGDVGIADPRLRSLRGLPSRAAALEHALLHAPDGVLVMQEPDTAYAVEDLLALVRPIEADEADVVLGRRPTVPRQDAAVARLAGLSLQHRAADLLCGQKAVRVSALRGLALRASGDEVEAELLLTLSQQQFRFRDVSVTASAGPRPVAQLRAFAGFFLRALAATPQAALHEGYTTLAALEAAAPNYNAWLGALLAARSGRRVLEIGAGIGTITAHLAKGRDLMVALEVEEAYVQRLRNRFRGQAHVEPLRADAALTDWADLRAREFDTVVLSNVLEHIEDDAAAVRRFSRLLPQGGTLLILVPALPALFGALDEAVGHFRRYTRRGLREVLEGNGFDVESVDWLNLVGIPGWFVNARLLKRRSLSPLQLRLYDSLNTWLARAEAKLRPPVGLSLFAVAHCRAPDAPRATAPAE